MGVYVEIKIGERRPGGRPAGRPSAQIMNRTAAYMYTAAAAKRSMYLHIERHLSLSSRSIYRCGAVTAAVGSYTVYDVCVTWG
jgi:hypothetical protein